MLQEDSTDEEEEGPRRRANTGIATARPQAASPPHPARATAAAHVPSAGARDYAADAPPPEVIFSHFGKLKKQKVLKIINVDNKFLSIALGDIP